MLASCRKAATPFYARRRCIFDTPEYYNRVFGELKQGEILEWYNIDWQDLKPLLESFFQSRPRRILDVGCGTSRLPAQLAQLATHQPRLIAGCDISPEAIAQQKAVAPPRSPGTRLIFSVGDVRRLPYPDLCFDLVLEKGLFDAVGSTRRGTLQLPTMLAEVWRVVAPGGALISMSQPGQAEMKSSSRSWLQQIQEADLQPAPVSVKEAETNMAC